LELRFLALGLPLVSLDRRLKNWRVFGDIEGKLDVLRVWEYRPALRTL
jgi:hypothetical protein